MDQTFLIDYGGKMVRQAEMDDMEITAGFSENDD